jgi:hypothetical protein
MLKPEDSGALAVGVSFVAGAGAAARPLQSLAAQSSAASSHLRLLVQGIITAIQLHIACSGSARTTPTAGPISATTGSGIRVHKKDRPHFVSDAVSSQRECDCFRLNCNHTLVCCLSTIPRVKARGHAFPKSGSHPGSSPGQAFWNHASGSQKSLRDIASAVQDTKQHNDVVLVQIIVNEDEGRDDSDIRVFDPRFRRGAPVSGNATMRSIVAPKRRVRLEGSPSSRRPQALAPRQSNHRILRLHAPQAILPVPGAT